MAVYGYVRVSTTGQAQDGESLAVQQRQLAGWAHMEGAELAEVFIEAGVSGAIPLAERVEGAKLWGALKPGDTIVASKLDRVFRSALDALQVVDALRKRRIALVLLDLAGDVTGNGLARTFMILAAAFAEAERERLRERVSVVKADQRRRGRYLGGKVPFGFTVVDGELRPVGTEQAMLADARRLRSEGRSLRAIRAALHAEHGRLVSVEALRRILAMQP